MARLDVRRFGFACGATAALVYVGCAIVMATVDHETQVLFFNTLVHGIDVAPVLRTDVAAWEAGVGIVETFILSWLGGASVAAMYNWAGLSKREPQ